MQAKKKILIIEDDQMIINAYTRILTTEGFEVFSARDGKQGLEAVKATQPDLILLDMLMPVMDGIEFLKEFKVNENPQTKVLVLSNSSSLEKLKEAKELGATEYMIKTEVKPVDVKSIAKGLLAAS